MKIQQALATVRSCEIACKRTWKYFGITIMTLNRREIRAEMLSKTDISTIRNVQISRLNRSKN